ncbi:MAG TPA: anthranilate phosphoribosyltransferase, partial [Candidatus Fraserbacteria bacterium]|nr:anthranilate phosphoribosyltransferase [Candidatus Fraserbacteria bacterium]
MSVQTMPNAPLRQALARLAERRDLDAALAMGALSAIMEGQAGEAQIGAFLMGLRVKGETIAEITALAQVMREKSVKIRPRIHVGATGRSPLLTDLCGTGGAPIKTFNVSTIAAFVVAGAGVPVAKHGNRSVSSLCGSADLLEALGLDLLAEPTTIERGIEEIGLGFLFAPHFHPAMVHAAPVRRALGLRTVFNLLGPLTNPADAQAQLLGVFRPDLVETYPQVLRNLGTARALVVHGEGGLDELSTIGSTLIGELREGQVRSYKITPEQFGLRRARQEQICALPPAQSAKLARQLLSGRLK